MLKLKGFVIFEMYLDEGVVGRCDEIIALWCNIQTGDGTMFTQDNASYFGAVNRFPVRNLTVGGQS